MITLCRVLRKMKQFLFFLLSACLYYLHVHKMIDSPIYILFGKRKVFCSSLTFIQIFWAPCLQIHLKIFDMSGKIFFKDLNTSCGQRYFNKHSKCIVLLSKNVIIILLPFHPKSLKVISYYVFTTWLNKMYVTMLVVCLLIGNHILSILLSILKDRK